MSFLPTLGKLVVLTAPHIGLAFFCYLLLTRGLEPKDIVLTALNFLLVGLGVTVGFHRYVTHGAFKTSRPIKAVLLVLGSMAWQGSVIFWTATHRMHHRFSDKDGDPHSPWKRDFFWAHIGWLFGPDVADRDVYVPDLLEDSLTVLVSKLMPLWSVLYLAIPIMVQGLEIGIACALTATCARNHVTWATNSACHIWGSRPFKTGNMSTNNWVFGVLGLGEGWHNNHHAFPWSARHGLTFWQVDLSWYLIWLLQKLHLVWDARVPSSLDSAVRR